MVLQIYEPGETPLPHAEEEIAVGIDLGTTNSLIAISKNNKAEILTDENGSFLQPSILAFDNQKFISGAEAKKVSGEKIYSIKRLMGKGIVDIENDKFLSFKIKNNEKQQLKILFAGSELSATQISAEILKHLKNIAEKNLGKNVKKAVITVPAYFSERARNETKNAAILAGLEVLRLISEPTAAALAYGLDKGSEGIFAVFDLGGGTFDISILKLTKGVFKVIGVSGDINLGGDDFDNLIFQKITENFSLKNLSELEIQELKLIAKKLKEDLTHKNQAKAGFLINNKNFEFVLTREEFNQLILPKVERAAELTSDLIQDLNLEIDEIKGVILVGGSTRTPLIKEKLAEIFGSNKILTDIDPDKAVALGAAIQAEALTFGSSNLLLDVTPLSLGIETMGGIVEKIIFRNSTIPTSVSKEFTTYMDGQTGMKIHIVQGERELAKDCRSLAHFEIKNIPPLKAGVARVKITFAIDADGLLTVFALEETTGEIQTIEVKPSYGLDENEIKEMLIDALQSSRKDIEARLLVEAKVETERNILAIKAAMKEDEELLNSEEQDALKKQITILEKLLELEDREKILENAEKLEALAKNFAEKKMNKYIGQVLTGKKVDEI